MGESYCGVKADIFSMGVILFTVLTGGCPPYVSINDGYFLNKWYYPPDDAYWIDLPASFHNGGTSFSFVDGHSENHRWLYAQTKAPPQPDTLLLPMDVTDDQNGDYYWLLGRMSVPK